MSHRYASPLIAAKVEEIADRLGLRRKGRRYEGPCPFCGGAAKSNKFSFYDDGGYYCFSCQEKGRIVRWLKEREGMSCPDAHEAVGESCTFADCPVRGTCRLGDGSGKRVVNRRAPLRVPSCASSPVLPRIEPKNPRELWSGWADNFVGRSAELLQANDEQLGWLARRGIDRDAAARFRLGWHEHDARVDRAAIGLAPTSDGRTKLWVPGGLVIPIFDRCGKIHRVRVRRTDAARAAYADGLKYVWLDGSGNAPLTIVGQGLLRGALIVEAELDAFAAAAACDELVVVAVGTVRGGIDGELFSLLDSLPRILVALDADQGSDGKLGPGPKAFAVWRSRFRHAHYWPVPQGKDVGDYAGIGGDLGAWIDAGLVPDVRVINRQQRPLQDFSFSPAENSRGGYGVENDCRTTGGDELERVADLKWCPLCWGDRFFAVDGGGCYCVACQEAAIGGRPGRMVRAMVPRGEERQYV